MHNELVRAVLAAAIAGSITSACSAARVAKPIARELFARALAEATCEGIAACCERFVWGTDGSCVANAEKAIASRPAEMYDAVTGGRCVEAFERILPKCALEAGDLEALRKACAIELEPAPPEGLACSSPCADGFECADFGKQIDGSKGPAFFCVRKQSVGLGESCHERFAADEVPAVLPVCEPAAKLMCDAGKTNRCIMLAQLDEACESRCADSLLCVNLNGQRTCAAQAKLGEPCRADNFAACEFGSYCEPSTSICRSQPGFGELCREGMCARGLRCEIDRCADPRTSTPPSCYGLTTLWDALRKP
jgi:hypothetical protein